MNSFLLFNKKYCRGKVRNDELTRANNIGTIDLGFVVCGSALVCTGPDALSDSAIFVGQMESSMTVLLEVQSLPMNFIDVTVLWLHLRSWI